MTCSIERCDKPILARGFCSTHYYRLLRHGDPVATKIAPKGTPDRERLERYGKRTPSGCIEWSGARNQSGYGKYQQNGKTRPAHRVAWEVHNRRSIPVGMQVCHRCDNPPCINPEHLFVGTGADNARDCVAKGRKFHTIGERHGMAKLTDSDIRVIRSRLNKGASYPTIAGEFAISTTTVWRIANDHSWSHVRDQ